MLTGLSCRCGSVTGRVASEGITVGLPNKGLHPTGAGSSVGADG